MAQSHSDVVNDTEVGHESSPSTRAASAGLRPASALARGIQIVEYTDSSVMRLNPQPMSASNDEAVTLLEEYLCPRKLVRLCADDLVRTVHFVLNSLQLVLH